IAQCRNCQKYFSMTPFEDQPGPAPAKDPEQPPAADQAPPAPVTAKAPKKGCFFKFLVLLLLLLILAAGVLAAGYKYLPELGQALGLPGLLDRIPFLSLQP
ncbi:MAG: hypothetical protein LBV70_01540, partial [Candidatus Adiutrix sp.]|nr:hypothetical protein [Candidatus Adiutrix sp.]